MKVGKELKVTNIKDYNVVLGSVNNKKSKAIYISVSAWAQPMLDDEINYSRLIKQLDKKIKQSLYNHINDKQICEVNKDRTIIDLDIRESGVKYGKRSFMNCEATLFLTSELQITSEKIKPVLEDITHLLTSIFDDNRVFSFHKRKK